MSTRHAWRSIARWVLLAEFALLLGGCGQQDKDGPHASATGTPVLHVTAMTIVPRDVPAFVESAGQAAGSKEVQVRARVAGILLKRNYAEGQPVKKGDLLFEIDPEPFQVAVQQARGQLAVQEANLGRAQREYARIEPLFKEAAVSQRDRDNAQADHESAKAALAVARAQLRQAEINLAYTRITAPIQGLASKANVSEGSLVSAGGDAGILTRVSQVDPIDINFSLSDNELLRLRQALAAGKLKLPADDRFTVQVKFGDGSAYSRVGRINFYDNLVNAATGTVDLRAELPNPHAEILPGQFVRVSVGGLVQVNAITVPQTAVFSTQQGKMVWVVESGKAVPRQVELGASNEGDFVVANGLKSGDAVILDHLLNLQPGLPVTIDAAAAARPVPGRAGA